MIKTFENFIKNDPEYKNIKILILIPEYYSGKKDNKIDCVLCKFYEKLGFEQKTDGDPLYIKNINSNLN